MASIPDGTGASRDFDLRKDPEIASNMAAEFASENEKFLNTHWGGELDRPSFISRILAQAAQLLSSMPAMKPSAAGGCFVPKSSESKNHNVFYEKALTCPLIRRGLCALTKSFSRNRWTFPVQLADSTRILIKAGFIAMIFNP